MSKYIERAAARAGTSDSGNETKTTLIIQGDERKSQVCINRNITQRYIRIG